jgi:hypothetical protein
MDLRNTSEAVRRQIVNMRKQKYWLPSNGISTRPPRHRKRVSGPACSWRAWLAGRLAVGGGGTAQVRQQQRIGPQWSRHGSPQFRDGPMGWRQDGHETVGVTAAGSSPDNRLWVTRPHTQWFRTGNLAGSLTLRAPFRADRPTQPHRLPTVATRFVRVGSDWHPPRRVGGDGTCG